MHIYIKEWPDKTATIMVKDECALWTFKTAEEAVSFCRNYYDIAKVDLVAFQQPHFKPAYPIHEICYSNQ